MCNLYTESRLVSKNAWFFCILVFSLQSVAKVEDVDSQRKFLILEELKCMGLFIVDKNESKFFPPTIAV